MSRRSIHPKSSFILKPACAAVLLAFGVHAAANPNGGAVVSGSASFNTVGNTLTVTNTPGAIINWQDFSINSNEITHFAQQSASSAVLNRVITNNPSVILGTLSSNGRVFLVNAGGIVFGAGSTVDVGGLVATTLNLSDANFLAGNNNFTHVPSAQSISNAGNITAQTGGEVYLIATSVENSGIINAPNGEILLVAGNSVQLVNSLQPNQRVSITAPAGAVTNVGQLIASAGSLGLFGAMVKNSGRVSADSAILQGGKIVFKASERSEIAGVVSANGVTGGAIQVLGNQVGVMDGAHISANGMQGGGTILVGGDYQGANAAIPNAQATYVAATASISANATQAGNGGKVIVWGDNTTRAFGHVSATGGAQSGNGGLIETSGHFLDVAGIQVDASASNGASGTWLLDPLNVTIQAAPAIDTGGAFSAANPSVWTPSATGSTILNTTIETALNQGTNVTITTTGAGIELGDIVVNAPINKVGTPPATLTLQATNGIYVHAPISSFGQLNLDFNAGAGGIYLTANVDTGGGTFTSVGAVSIDPAATLTLNSSNTFNSLLVGGILAGTGTQTIAALGTLGVGSGGQLNAAGIINNGTFTLNGGATGSTVLNNTGNVIVSAGAKLTLTGGNSTAGTFSNNGDLVFSGVGYSITQTILNQAGNLSIAPGVTVTLPSFTNTGTLSGSGTYILSDFVIQAPPTLGTLTNSGIIAPSSATGNATLSITGNLILNPSSQVNLDINSILVGSYDALNVSGTADLNGTLNVYGVGAPTLYNAVITSGGLTGAFATIAGPHIVSTAAYNATNVNLTIITNNIAALSNLNYWVGTAGNSDWATASNWSLGAVPTALSNVYISPDAGLVTISSGTQFANSVQSDAGLNLQAGSLTLAADSQVFSFTQAAPPSQFQAPTAAGGTLNFSSSSIPTTFSSATNMLLDGAINSTAPLVLQAGNNLTLNSFANLNSTATTGNAFTLQANTNNAGSAGGALGLYSASITTQGGVVSFLNNQGAVNLNGAMLNTQGMGLVQLQSGSAVDLYNLQPLNTGTFQIITPGTVTVGGNGGGSFVPPLKNTSTLLTSTQNAIEMTAGSITFGNGVGAEAVSGGISLVATGAIELDNGDAGASYQALAGDIIIISQTGNIDALGGADLTAQNITLSAAGTLDIYGYTLGNIVATGVAMINTGAGLTNVGRGDFNTVTANSLVINAKGLVSLDTIASNLSILNSSNTTINNTGPLTSAVMTSSTGNIVLNNVGAATL
ncbi:MAG: filamentous hemagglutinin N-terminal domain-containing protein, partial [Sideroxydans sp.]